MDRGVGLSKSRVTHPKRPPGPARESASESLAPESAIRFPRFLFPLAGTVILVAACASPQGPPPILPVIDYVGSSTIANYIRDAEQAYGHVRFRIDTEPESVGGEQAIREGRADLAGVAGAPSPETLSMGIEARAIAKDAIAVIVNQANPVTALSRRQLSDIFTGATANWNDVGGPDLAVHPYIVGPESATRSVFRSAILGTTNYGACEVVRPDQAIPHRVSEDPGGIGQISFSFLGSATGVKTVSVEGQAAKPSNLDYPITRPLHLLWRKGNTAVERFVEWALSEAGQRLAMKRFISIRVVGEVLPEAAARRTGTLIVYTDTMPVYDGGIYYYPHRPYEILSRDGKALRNVTNHRGNNDEKPAKVRLAPGTYLIRPEVSSGQRPDLLVTIEASKTTSVYVEDLLRARK